MRKLFKNGKLSARISRADFARDILYIKNFIFS